MLLQYKLDKNINLTLEENRSLLSSMAAKIFFKMLINHFSTMSFFNQRLKFLNQRLKNIQVNFTLQPFFNYNWIARLKVLFKLVLSHIAFQIEQLSLRVYSVNNLKTLMIMSAVILDSIRLRKDKPHWQWAKCLSGAFCLRFLLHPKVQKIYFCYLMDPELRFLHIDRWQDETTTLGFTARGAYKCEICHFAVLAR